MKMSTTYNRDKINIRPSLPHAIANDHMSRDEIFQNQTLRPILKMQDELIQILVSKYIKTKKSIFYNLSPNERPSYVKNVLLSDRNIIHELRGIVIGLFSSDEVEYYVLNKASINKRIQSLLLQRILTHYT